ncbi:Mut7-C RNAse domain-containing protein [Thermodesulfobacteriota bacterium]
MKSAEIIYHDGISRLLNHPLRGINTLHYPLLRTASIKDVIESTGIPHTEIGRLQVNGADIDFSYILQDSDRVEVWPCHHPVDVLTPTQLCPTPLPRHAFIVDINVGKLAGWLRFLGFDAKDGKSMNDQAIAECSHREGRIVLTRDKSLLKRKIVLHGHLVRATEPFLQIQEVIRFYGLRELIKPFTRCLRCNGILASVRKDTIENRLQPLTRKYYHHFKACPDCDAIYWAGSHVEKMNAMLERILRDLDQSDPGPGIV